VVAQKGRDLLIKIKSGNEFLAIGGAREKTITINNEPVDVTNSDSSGVRALLENAGVNSVSVKLQGVYVDDEHLGALRELALSNLHQDFQLVIPGDTSNGTYEGTFMVASLEESGTYNQSMGYNLTLESAGPVTFE